jgi:hypothetical protein
MRAEYRKGERDNCRRICIWKYPALWISTSCNVQRWEDIVNKVFKLRIHRPYFSKLKSFITQDSSFSTEISNLLPMRNQNVSAISNIKMESRVVSYYQNRGSILWCLMLGPLDISHESSQVCKRIIIMSRTWLRYHIIITD